MHIRCPHCQAPVDVENDAPEDVLTCIACGSTFNLLSDTANMQLTRLTPQIIGRFELLEEVGVGRSGESEGSRYGARPDCRDQDSRRDKLTGPEVNRARGSVGGSAQTSSNRQHRNWRDDETIPSSATLSRCDTQQWLKSQP
jgi:hypothetical protein